MNDPAENKVTWAQILRVNARFVLACISLIYGWFFWTRASLEWFGFWFIGFCGLVGGVGLMIHAIYESYGLIARHTQWSRFRRLGVKPRSDRMAHEDEILNREDKP